MSIQAVGWALEQELPAGPKLVLVAIANHANHADGYCWLNAETIAKEASCKPRSVYRFGAALIRNGFLRREKKRGSDGRQRSNDYWILFNREAAKWDWGGAAHDGSDVDQDDAETHSSDDGDPLDIVDDLSANLPSEPSLSPGQSDDDDSRKGDKTPSMSPGPTVVVVTHSITAEPSKTNPLKGIDPGKTPRGYKPPPPQPPQPMGATTVDGAGDFIFVFVGTRAYEAWQKVKTKEIGRPWKQQTMKNGRWGWHFRTLFPPEEKPPPSSLMTADDLDQFSKTG